jgi:hypothetical protein
MVFARQILIQQLDTSGKIIFSRIEGWDWYYFSVDGPNVRYRVTLTVPIASGIKLFKKGQLRCFAVCASIAPVKSLP